MSYPQPDSDLAIVNSQKFFRLLTTLFTDGDMYQSKIGCHAIGLGPESDISKVNVAYFDQAQQGNMGRFTVDPQRAWSAAVSSFNDRSSVYTPTQNEARILFWPDNLWNNSYRPVDADESSRIDIVSPVLDVIQYLEPPETLQSSRTDKYYHYQNADLPKQVGLTGRWFLVVPFYGRKYASVSFNNRTDTAINLTVRGVNYLYNTTSPATEFEYAASAAVAPNGVRNVPVRASTVGMADSLMLVADYAAAPTGIVNARIVTSDNPL